ncbi:lamin tail domain-containing protein [Patescibacteria group bacterium]
MNKKIKIFILISIILIIPNFVLASVVINEIAWMGTINSSNDEWIELYNNTDKEIDLTDWTLKAIDGSPEINLIGFISANDFFILERTDDDSVPNAIANQIYTGALGNDGEYLELRNNNRDLIDSVDGWSAGDNTTKQTMERTQTGWQTSHDPNGTPKAKNSDRQTPLEEIYEKEESEDTPEEFDKPLITTQKITQTSQPPVANAGSDITALANQEIIFDGSKSYSPNNNDLDYFWNFGDGATDTKQISFHTYSMPGQYIAVLQVNDNEISDSDTITINIYNRSVIISEFMPDPDGADEQNEWIEIYNQSSEVSNLSGWQIDDKEKGSKPFIFPQNSLIAPKQFLILKRPITKLSLNNDEDEVRLIYPNGEIASQIKYSGGNKKDRSVAFDGIDYFWTSIPTPGAANIISNQEIKLEKISSSNNPKLIANESQDPPDVLSINLTNSEDFSASNISKDSNNQIDIQTQNLLAKIKPLPNNNSNPTPQNNKANLVLILSIIISCSLLTFWISIIIRKKQFIH